MQKFRFLVFTIVVLVITLFNFSGIFTSYGYVEAFANGGGGGGEGDLGCNDITGCSGSASCGSSGTVAGCTITCKDNTKITCNNASN